MLPMNAATAGWQHSHEAYDDSDSWFESNINVAVAVAAKTKHEQSRNRNEKAPTAEVVQQMQYTYIHKEKWPLLYSLF